MRYAEPTPIQAEAIPVALAGRDLIATEQIGAGKVPPLARAVCRNGRLDDARQSRHGRHAAHSLELPARSGLLRNRLEMWRQAYSLAGLARPNSAAVGSPLNGACRFGEHEFHVVLDEHVEALVVVVAMPVVAVKTLKREEPTFSRSCRSGNTFG
jgi:hypothetical protein